MVVQNDHVIHWIAFFHPLNHVPCASFYQGLWILIKMSLMNSIHPNFANCAQGHSFFVWGLSNFIYKCIVDACCNE